jgi:glutamate synthase (NADPH/NADH) large chain
MVDLDPLDAADVERVRELLQRHMEETESARAADLLAGWPDAAGRFTKVMPRDYKRVLRLRADAIEKGLDPMVAVMGALNG